MSPNFVLFGLTILSVYLVGRNGWELPRVDSIKLTAAVLAIMLAHEMGHYVACRIYGVHSTLPFFIPAPWAPIGPGLTWMPLSFIGTFGAVIRIKAPFPNRKVLFDVGIAGPLCGFVVACIVMVLGLSLIHI